MATINIKNIYDTKIEPLYYLYSSASRDRLISSFDIYPAKRDGDYFLTADQRRSSTT